MIHMQTPEPRPQRKMERIRASLLWPMALAICGLLGAFLFAFHQDQKRRSAQDLDRAAQQVNNLFHAEMKQSASVMSTALHALLRDERLEAAFRLRDRAAVLARARVVFDSLCAQHHITHLYFHTPERINFVRAHKPHHFGDKINRFTALEAERTGKPATGIERGPIGTFVKRLVFPWVSGGELIGYVELGKEFEDIAESVHGKLDVDIIVAVDKKHLDREVWEKALQSHEEHDVSWDQFPASVVMDKTVATIPEPVARMLTERRQDDMQGDYEVAWNQRTLQVIFLPLRDVRGMRLGHLVVLRDVTQAVADARRAMFITSAISLSVGLALVVFFYVFLGRIERELAARTQALHGEIAERKHAQGELKEAHDTLERRVQERTAELARTNTALQGEIAERKEAEKRVDALNKMLVQSAREAGRADVATSVLHNVGNVLNSVNVSSTLLKERVAHSKLAGLGRVTELMRAHAHDLAAFLTDNPQGKQLPPYLELLAQCWKDEQEVLLRELESLTKYVNHIRDVVNKQQSLTGASDLAENVSLSEAVDDALKMSGLAHNNGIRVVREDSVVETVYVDRMKLMMVLVNLLRNAKEALEASDRADQNLILRLQNNGGDCVRVEVFDNGVGIAPEHITRIFAWGFTTKKDGHGFGLHSSALAATEMGGSLQAHSDGPGKGARFVLELPANHSNQQRGKV